ncbi:MAG: alpha/beta hydrolase [Prevotella sp.]
MNTRHIATLLLMMLACTAAQAQRSFTQNLWEGKPIVKGKDQKDTAKVTVCLPAPEKANGRAVIICPGGGYATLSMDSEGCDWAPFFNEMGIAAIILKYRMPHGERMVPISDAEEAFRLARRNAAAWGLKTDQIGIMGFSAGGHLASTIATHSRGDAAPDFQILFYPVISMDPAITGKASHANFFGKKAKQKDELLYSNEKQVSRFTPRAFIVMSADDQTVNPMNSVNYYQALYRHDVPVSLYAYPTGGHGYGIKPTFPYHRELLMELEAWLRSF